MISLIAGALSMPSASADATCVEQAACAGEASQSPCGGPSPKMDPWDNFTGVWGNVSGWEWGVGGWSRCVDTEWSAGAFVNNDKLPVGEPGHDYQTVMVRFDYTERSGRFCYAGFGAYGLVARDYYYPCPSYVTPNEIPEEVQDPGWGHVLG